MERSDKYYAHLFIQVISVLLLCLFLYLSFRDYPLNIYLFIVTIILFVFGLFREIGQMLVAASIVLLIFGGYIVYRTWFSEPPGEIGWNELVWLAIVPYFSLIGSISRKTHHENTVTTNSLFYLPNASPGTVGPAMVDERHGYLSGMAFLYKLEEEVLAALRERKKFYLLVIEIDQLREFKRIFGKDQAELMLNQIAEWFLEFAENGKAQLGENLLGGIITTTEPEEIKSVQDKIEAQFYDMLLSRPRRESTVKLKLKFGVAECPSDGIEARALLEKTKNDLAWNGV